MVAVARTLHPDEVAIDVGLVRSLLAEQFPGWVGLPVERVRTPGSDHVLYRVGTELVARLPRKDGVEEQIDKERKWLPRLAPLLPVAVPVPVAKGRPSIRYPFAWSIYRWLPGSNPGDRLDAPELARDLARFVGSLQVVDNREGPPASAQNFGRGEPLRRRDERTRAAIGELGQGIDVELATVAWEDALDAQPWRGSSVWLHGDLTPENLLVHDSRLAAVIDWGCMGIGDPACDLMVAWSVLSGAARDVFRAEVEVDDATWSRARGWALSTAVIALPYYEVTHLPRAANARTRIEEVLIDLGGCPR